MTYPGEVGVLHVVHPRLVSAAGEPVDDEHCVPLSTEGQSVHVDDRPQVNNVPLLRVISANASIGSADFINEV